MNTHTLLFTSIFWLSAILFSTSSITAQTEESVTIEEEITDDGKKKITKKVIRKMDGDVKEHTIKSTFEKEYQVVIVDDNGERKELKWDGTGEMPAEMKALLDEHDINIESNESLTKEIEVEVDAMDDENIDIKVIGDVDEENMKVIVKEINGEKVVTVTVDDESDKKPRLGVMIEDVSDGIRITEIIKDSKADKAGLEAGDIITSINGINVNNSDMLINIVQNIIDDARISYDRDGKEMSTMIQF